MKLFYLLTFILACFCVNAQHTEFKFTKDGMTDFVVGKVEGKTAQELFKKTLDWVAITYKNPKEVIKAQIDNDYIRIEGSKSNMICSKSLGITNCSDARYQVEISFKDGRYKFDVISLEQYTPVSKYTSPGWSSVPLVNTSVYYKENGEIRSLFKLVPSAVETTFNSLNMSLLDFLMSDAIPSQKVDW